MNWLQYLVRSSPIEFVAKRLSSGRDLAIAGAAMLILLALMGQIRAADDSLSVQLNKLEPQGSGCRAYIVVNNKSSTTYQALKLDLILFQPDGIIGRRFAFDLAPLKPNKQSVKLFDIDTPCDQIGSFLVNDVLDCKADSGPLDDCLSSIAVSSLTKVQLTK